MSLLDHLPIFLALHAAVKHAEPREVHHPILVLLIDRHASERVRNVAILGVLPQVLDESIIVAGRIHVVHQIDLVKRTTLLVLFVDLFHILHFFTQELSARIFARMTLHVLLDVVLLSCVPIKYGTLQRLVAAMLQVEVRVANQITIFTRHMLFVNLSVSL